MSCPLSQLFRIQRRMTRAEVLFTEQLSRPQHWTKEFREFLPLQTSGNQTNSHQNFDSEPDHDAFAKEISTETVVLMRD